MDFNRFKNLACWTLVMDRRWYLRTALGWMVAMTLLFLFFTCMVKFDNAADGVRPYQACAIMPMAMLTALVVMGPAYMFLSMKGRHDDRRLLMLPASNLEKYVMRYLSWVLLLPLCVVALVCADVVQYVVNLLLRHEDAVLVVQTVWSWMASLLQRGKGSDVADFLLLWVPLGVWAHSCYAVGAVLFRTHRYNWILSSVAILLLLVALSMLLPYHLVVMISAFSHVMTVLFLVWAVLNIWLSYRLFCRMQVAGRFINL